MSGAVVVMGVAGSGKSTLARALAERLGWQFVEGDALHPPENIGKMRAGIALQDADREPFLRAVAGAINAGCASGVVASCSALRRTYRSFIAGLVRDVRFVLPIADRDTLRVRLKQRSDHFMPVALLDSQLATLELPDPDERAVVVDGTAPTDVQVEAVMTALGLTGVAESKTTR